MNFVDRLREPSTWAGFAILLSLVGVKIPNEAVHAVSEAGVALASLAAIVLRERKH